MRGRGFPSHRLKWRQQTGDFGVLAVKLTRKVNALKILITGARGMLGRDLVAMLGASHQVLGVDVDEMDITDSSLVRRTVAAFGPAAMVNAAAHTQVDRCESEEELAMRINADGPQNLARAASDAGAKLFHVSTDYVFDGSRPHPEPYVEDDPPNPQSVYGRSKLEGERRVLATSPRHVVLRTAWLYGMHGHNFLKTMLRFALEGRDLNVVDDQFGCPTWSETLAAQIKAVVEAPDASGIYHAVGCGWCSWYAFASTFLNAMEVPHRIEPCASDAFPRPAKRPKNAVLQNRRLEGAGLLAMRPWEVDLTEFVAKYRAQLIEEWRLTAEKRR